MSESEDRNKVYYVLLMKSSLVPGYVEARIDRHTRSTAKTEELAIRNLGVPADRLRLFRYNLRPVPLDARSCVPA